MESMGQRAVLQRQMTTIRPTTFSNKVAKQIITVLARLMHVTISRLISSGFASTGLFSMIFAIVFDLGSRYWDPFTTHIYDTLATIHVLNLLFYWGQNSLFSNTYHC